MSLNDSCKHSESRLSIFEKASRTLLPTSELWNTQWLHWGTEGLLLLRVSVEIPGISSEQIGMVWLCLKFSICLLLCFICFVGRNLLTNFISSYIFCLSFQLYFQSRLFIKHTVVCWQNSLLHFKCSIYHLVSAGCFIYFLAKT